jgi:mycothiol system anti-sigma-R factor
MTKVDSINCDEALKLLFEYLDHELDPQHHAEVEQHLHTCRACFSRAEFERRLKGRLAGLGREPAPDEFEQRIRKLIERY